MQYILYYKHFCEKKQLIYHHENVDNYKGSRKLYVNMVKIYKISIKNKIYLAIYIHFP